MLCWTLLILLGLADALPSQPFLLYSNITNIHAIDLKSFRTTNILSGLDKAVPLAIDTVDRHVFYGEKRLGYIFRTNYDGSNKTLILDDVKNIEGLAIDWIGRKIYWTMYKSERIDVSTLDGKFRKVLINTGLEYPRGIAVDPNAGYLFWSDSGAAVAIERCSLAGKERKALVRDHFTWPIGISIDYNAQRVYWIDALHDTISSVDYNGGHRKLIFEDLTISVSRYRGYNLDVIGESLYWSDWSSNAIFGLNIATGKEFKNIHIPTTNDVKGSIGLVIVDASRQPSGSSNCGNDNGGCEQLCFHTSSNIECACALGMELAADGKSCVDAFKDEFLMFADGDAGKVYQMQLDSLNVEPVPIPFEKRANISRPVALDFDPVEDRVYWTDVTLGIICRAFRNGSGFEVLHQNRVGIADGLAIDLAGRNLYWTSTSYDTIEVSRLNGSFRRVLIGNYLSEPRDIIVDPIDGFMYWSDWGIPKIERAHMNGENRTVLVSKKIRSVNGLTIDHVHNKLYWADGNTIERMDLITKQRKVILNRRRFLFLFWLRFSIGLNHPFGLTLLHDHIYWTDWRTDSVYRADVNTGANVKLLTGNLGKPMDIHAYSIKPRRQYRLHYTFSFPSTGSEFECVRRRSRFCSQMNPPPACPPGYRSQREGSVCRLKCRDRCPCNDWISCAVKERYSAGCGHNRRVNVRVRECIQEVKSGRCPGNLTQGSLTQCVSDTSCPGVEKCCNSRCTSPVSIGNHSCQQNNGGCDQLCFAVPGGHKCGCENGLYYDESQRKCVNNTRPTVPVTTLSPSTGCEPFAAPDNGDVRCDGNPVPLHGSCVFLCNEFYRLKGVSFHTCYSDGWAFDDAPTCVVDTRPELSGCPDDILTDAEPGENFRMVNWSVPTAFLRNGSAVPVSVYPEGFIPPLKFEIGGPYNITYTAVMDGEMDTCEFSVTVFDLEPPTFGETCPTNRTYYTGDMSGAMVTPTLPVATDNSKKPPAISVSGLPGGGKFPVGRSVIRYVAEDAAGLTAECVFTVTVVVLPSSKLSSCPDDIVVDTEPKKNYRMVNWKVPTASLQNGSEVQVSVYPKNYKPPMKFEIGGPYNITYTARIHGKMDMCKFSVKVLDREPPTFGRSCPANNSYYTEDVSGVVVTITLPVATDNSKKSPAISISGLPSDRKFPVGRSVIKYVAKDEAGLRAECVFTVTVVFLPSAKLSSCPDDIRVGTEPKKNYRMVNWTVPSASLHNGSVVQVSVYPENYKPPMKFEIGGPYNITYTARIHGKMDMCKFSITVLDREPPSFGKTCPVNNTYYSDNISGAVVNITSPVATDNSKKPPGISISGLPSGGKFSLGRSVIRYVAEDDAGLRAECVFTVTVIILPSPKLSSCPDDIVVDTEAKKNYQMVNWNVPRASLQNGSVVQVSVYPENYKPPMKFEIGGPYNIKYTARILGKMDMCEFSITVLDHEPPTFGRSCPENNTYYTDDVSGTVVRITSPVATDNSKKPPAISISGLPSGGKFPVGRSVIRYVAEDEAGLRAECVFTVTVVILPSPELSSCPDDIVDGTEANENFRDVSWIVPSASLQNGSAVDVSVHPKNYKPPMKFEIGGPYNITYTARIHGKMDICKFSVTVSDREPPTFGGSCPANNTYYSDDVSGAVVDVISPVATDNSKKSPAISISGLPSGKKFPVGRSMIRYFAEDEAGLRAECVFTVTVVILPSPKLSSCPDDIVVDAEPKKNYRVVNWNVPRASLQNGSVVQVSVHPKNYKPPMKFEIGGPYNITYTARIHGKMDMCKFFVTVLDREPPTFGRSCLANNTYYTDDVSGLVVDIKSPVATDNSKKPPAISISGIPSGGKFPVGRSVIRYVAEDDAGLKTECVLTATVVNVCRDVSCPFGSRCSLNVHEGNTNHCVCDSTCPQVERPVCGSDGMTYKSQCRMNAVGCLEMRRTYVIVESECGCKSLDQSDVFRQTSNMTCQYRNGSVNCEVVCLSGSKSVFPQFLNIQCHKKQWIRMNTDDKYVPVGTSSPPRCYRTLPKDTSSLRCPLGHNLVDDVCVPCPPGTYESLSRCLPCNVTTYQDTEGQTSCKLCSDKAGSVTSTATGAESCFFQHGPSSVTMSFNMKLSKVELRQKLATDLTKVCERFDCSFDGMTNRRRKRNAEKYVFEVEHIIVIHLSREATSSSSTAVLLALDPKSTSLLPDEAFSSENLRKMLFQIANGDLPITRIDGVLSPQASTEFGAKSGGGSSSSKTSVVTGAVVGIIALIGIIFAIRMIVKRRTPKRQDLPPVHFSLDSAGGSSMHIGHRTPAHTLTHENLGNNRQDTFFNHIYRQVDDPPPCYDSISIHKPEGTYELPDYESADGDQAGALPIKDPLPPDAVVEVPPHKDGEVVFQSSLKAESSVNLVHKQRSENLYEVPVMVGERPKTPKADDELRFQPRQNFDNTSRQMMRERGASSILPNAPRKKRVPVLDDNAKEESTSHYQNVHNVTKKESES